MIEQILFADTADSPIDWYFVMLGILLSFLGGQALAWTYMLTHSGLSYSRTYVNSLVIIPLLVCLVMMVLSNNLITAFGLMALFAIVRFRNILRDTLDTCYILSCITVGMACGTGRFGTALIGLLAICGILLYLSFTQFGTRHRFDMILNLHWSRSLSELADLSALLRRHTRKAVCASQRAFEDEPGADLSYRLLLRDPDRMGDLLEEVRSLHGTARVTGMSAQDESEL